MTSSSSSSSSQAPQIMHDVFISFRGTDTRCGFVSHLNEALCQKKIDVYVDYELERGDQISTALRGAIERSQISLIVFSRDYASSTWCLDELVKIMECFTKNGQVVIPVFYNIDPSYVRNLKGSYGDAFAEYGKVFGGMVKVQNWSNALNKAANLSGFHSSNFGTEVELIKQIVESVLKKLKHIYIGRNNPKVLVGIHEKVACLESLAVLESKDVRIIGIWGMGGIGKTTIAKELYDRLRPEYEACCFLPNVRESLEKYGMTRLQNEFVGALLEEKDRSIGILIVDREYNMVRLRRKKILLVIDDVDGLLKLRNLFGGRHWFGQGSRVIVTSRDKQVLTNVVDVTYEVKALKFEDSLQLFSLHAFKEKYPKLEWMDLSRRAVGYAKGIPLAIEVLGSFLYGKKKEVWESELEKLKKIPHPEIQNVLRLSYDGLDREDQENFLLLACYSYNLDISKLDACGYSMEAGLTNLHNKALLYFFNETKYRHWKMHELIRDMGKEIVVGESSDPGKRRHLWDPHDVYQVLENATGTGAIQSLILCMSSGSKELHLSPKAFNGMFNLKILNIDDYKSKASKIFAPKDLESMPNGLRLLRWNGCPLKSLPSSFYAENLVDLHLTNSSLERLWDGVQNLVNLGDIFLDGCEQLMELPDFSKALNLTRVRLSYCIRLCDVHPSILSLHNLKELLLYGCEKIKSLRSDICLKSLCNLGVHGCSSLEEFSVMSESVHELDLTNTRIVEVQSLGLPLNKFENLNCKFSESLPHNFLQVHDLWALRKSMLDFFAPRYSFPFLEKLWLSGSNVESLPTSIKHLSVLKELVLRNCRRLRFLPELPPSISLLNVSNCVSLEGVSISTVDCCSHEEAEFILENCGRLSQQTLNTIMSNAHVKMKQAAYIQHLRPYDDTVGNISVWLPGSKVLADRYNYRTTTEATMTIQLLSPTNFIGLIFYFIVPSSEVMMYTSPLRFRCYLQTGNDQANEGIFDFTFHGIGSSPIPMELDSDHVFLYHDERFSRCIIAKIKESSYDNQCKAYNPELLFQIIYYFGIKIKKWGVCPIYSSDLFTFSDQLALGAKTKRHRDSDELLDMEPLPPTKKLKTEWKKRLEFEPSAHCLIVKLWELYAWTDEGEYPRA